MSTPTVSEALRVLRRAIDNEARDHIASALHAYLGRKPMVCNAMIEGCTITKLGDDKPLTIAPEAANGRAPKSKRTAGRARQAAAMRAYWKKRKAAKGRK